MGDARRKKTATATAPTGQPHAAALPAGKRIKLHPDQFDVLSARMDTLRAKEQLVQAMVNAELQPLREKIVALLQRLGLDPSKNYHLDDATRTLTLIDTTPPADGAPASA